ncbi:MAG: cation diffusion facilitator family transporter [Fervidobacterium sp.]|jgi:cobalt-zinc-cadmium efflux system protein
MNKHSHKSHENASGREHLHNHSHSRVQQENLRGVKLFYVIILNFGITIAEFLGGVVAGSLALVSDSLHNLSDALSIVLTYFAYKISKKGATERNTFGYKRAKVISASINSVTLIVINVLLIKEAIVRLLDPQVVNAKVVIIVGSIGLLANMLSMVFLKNHSKEDMNIKSAYLHMLGDALSSVVVILGAILINYFQVYVIDPALTILIALYISKETLEVLAKSLSVLMQASPSNIQIKEIADKLKSIPEVKDIHHVHMWYLDDEMLFFEGHVNLKEDISVSKSMEIYERIEKTLSNFGFDHVTIQFEYNGCPECGLITKKEA